MFFHHTCTSNCHIIKSFPNLIPNLYSIRVYDCNVQLDFSPNLYVWLFCFSLCLYLYLEKTKTIFIFFGIILCLLFHILTKSMFYYFYFYVLKHGLIFFMLNINYLYINCFRGFCKFNIYIYILKPPKFTNIFLQKMELSWRVMSFYYASLNKIWINPPYAQMSNKSIF